MYVIVWVHRWVPRGKRCSSSCWSDTRRPLRCSVLQRSEIGKGEEGAIRGLRERHAHTHTHTRTHTHSHTITHTLTHTLSLLGGDTVLASVLQSQQKAALAHQREWYARHHLEGTGGYRVGRAGAGGEMDGGWRVEEKVCWFVFSPLPALLRFARFNAPLFFFFLLMALQQRTLRRGLAM